MWQFLIAVEEELHALDSRLVGLVHKAPSDRCGCSRYWVLLWRDVCDWLCIGIQLIGYLCRDFVAGDSIAALSKLATVDYYEGTPDVIPGHVRMISTSSGVAL
jgi:hypothetical protein